MTGEEEGGAIRWEVGPAQIDLYRWARAIVTATATQAQGDRRNRPRWGIWPTFGLIGLIAILLTAVTGDTWILAAIAAPAVIVAAGAFALNRNSARLLARRLRATPAASEPFTFVADVTGTRDASPSGSSDQAWSRYTAVTIDDGLVLLTLDGGAIRVLPIDSLATGQAPDAAVEQIRCWIDNAKGS